MHVSVCMFAIDGNAIKPSSFAYTHTYTHTKDDNRFFHYQIGRFLRSALKFNIIEKNNTAFGSVTALAIVFFLG